MANAAPPRGTVTFLFTDIEGSTALYENHPDRMRSARKRHDEILRSCIESHEGYVFKTVGDAFCAAFATAREAVQAALASQRALHAERWPESTELRVRMGLHTGVAEESEGDYFGPPVNRVARLMSTGHGGQILLSDATYNLVRDALTHMEPDAKLRYLGEHRLKDLRYTERIFQLVVPDLPKEFEPLRTHGLITPEEVINLDRRYRRIRYLGGGGFGNVYLVHHEALDRDMALKVLGQQYAEDEQFKERFKREARSAAKLNSPNIVQVYDAGEGYFDGQKSSYITMEYVPGGTLEDLIAQQGGPLPARTATELTLQVARALEVAHRSGVIHRDIKPQNILITESGEAKVADFGIARAAASSTKLTRTGLLMGTLHYMSPEQANGKPASPRSDLYSLGVVLYQALTGQLPFDAETPAAVMVKHITEPLRPPKEVNPDVPEGINAACIRLLAKEPDERYPDASALIEDLERVQRSPEGTASARTTSNEEDATFAETILDEADPAFAETIPPGQTEASSTVEVPDLSGQAPSQAGDTLADAGLKLGATEEAPSETVPEGEIISQVPEAGTEVEPGSLVSATVSTRPQRITAAGSSGEQGTTEARQAEPSPSISQVRNVRSLLVRCGAGGALLVSVTWILLLTLMLYGEFTVGEVITFRLEHGITGIGVNMLFAFPLIAMVVGLVGFHTLQQTSYGRLGLTGFLASLIGITFLLMLKALVIFSDPFVFDQPFGIDTADVVRTEDFLAPPGYIFTFVGLVILGAATLKTGARPQWLGWSLILTSGFFLVSLLSYIRADSDFEIRIGIDQYTLDTLLVGLSLVLIPTWLALAYALWWRRGED